MFLADARDFVGTQSPYCHKGSAAFGQPIPPTVCALAPSRLRKRATPRDEMANSDVLQISNGFESIFEDALSQRTHA